MSVSCVHVPGTRWLLLRWQVPPLKVEVGSGYPSKLDGVWS